MMSAEPIKYSVTWGQVDVAAKLLTGLMRQYNYKPQRILAVARGGLIPATILSHKLGVRDVGVIRAESYKENVVGSGANNVVITDTLDYYKKDITPDTLSADWLERTWNHHDTLVVDDLWDSGETHKTLGKLLPRAVFSTLFYRDRGDNSHLVVSYPGLCLMTRDWIEFPWER